MCSYYDSRRGCSVKKITILYQLKICVCSREFVCMNVCVCNNFLIYISPADLGAI